LDLQRILFKRNLLDGKKTLRRKKPIVPDLRPVVAPAIEPETEMVPEPKYFSVRSKKWKPEAIITPRDAKCVAPSNLPVADEENSGFGGKPRPER